MSASHRIPTAGRRRWLAVITGVVLVSMLAFGTQPASARTIATGGWHRVCAHDVALYDSKYHRIGTLYWHDPFDVYRYGEPDHVWGYTDDPNGAQYGWIHNGWFC